MTAKEQRFCEEYLIDLNATKAAIRAGYSEKSARSIGCENLTKQNIQEYISERRKELTDKLSLDNQWVLQRFKIISDRCVQAIPVMEFDSFTKQMVQKKDFNEAGEEVGVWEFDSSGANKATEMIGKHLGFFEKDNRQQAPTAIKHIVQFKDMSDGDSPDVQ